MSAELSSHQVLLLMSLTDILGRSRDFSGDGSDDASATSDADGGVGIFSFDEDELLAMKEDLWAAMGK
jgi:hypothetical protein